MQAVHTAADAVRCAAPPRSTAAALLALALVALAATATAQDTPAGVKLEVGLEERVRAENWDDITDFDAGAVDARHQLRFRTRAWAKLSAGANDEFVIGLVNESCRMTTPQVALTMDETVFETLYLDHRFRDVAALRVGRQNLTRGDGFVLMDGGPLDGSRSTCVNALDLAWTPGKARLDLLVVSDPYRDRYLPRIHDRTKSLIEWDEHAVGLYWSDPRRARTTLDAYWFHKTESNDRRALTSAARQSDHRFHTLGGRLVRQLDGAWTLTAEGAGQAGTREPTADVRGWGGQATVRRTFAHATKPSLAVGFVGLSGDDPATTDDEGWDPPFSRFPRWSESYIYTLGSERGPSFWTNLAMWQAELRLTPVKPLDLRATYSRMDAFHRFPGKPALYAGRTHRGDLLTARADLKVNDEWRGHVLAEWLAPGDFYSASDAGWFFRAEVVCTIKRVLEP